MLPDFASLDAVIIESIHAEATYNSTGKVRQYGAAHNVSGTIHTEGQLFGYLTALYPSLLILEVPRFNILKAYMQRWPYTKGDKVDNIVKAMLKRVHPAAIKPLGLLSTPDKRDAYLASIYLTLGQDLPMIVHPPSYPAGACAPESESGKQLIQPPVPNPDGTASRAPTHPLAACSTLALGIDPGASLATSTWLLQRDGLPLATGKCDALLT